MVKKDDRTDEQKLTHYWAVVGRDKFLSGWGGAAGGYSRAAWACPDLETAQRIEPRIRARGDMQYVSVVDLRSYRPPRGTKHFHIYIEKGRE